MSSINELPTSGGINSWVDIMRPTMRTLADHINSDRVHGFIAIKELGLPTSKHLVFKPITSFLANPREHLEEIGADQFFVNISSSKADLNKFRCIGLYPQDIIPYISSRIPQNSQEDYNLFIGEYLENLYGGSILINPDGNLLLEMVKGLQHSLAEGSSTPQYRVTRDQFTGIFHYESTNSDSQDTFSTDLREAVWKTISCIPTEEFDSPRDRNFLKGYYEFILVQRANSKKLEPQFIDYNDNPAYFSLP